MSGRTGHWLSVSCGKDTLCWDTLPQLLQGHIPLTLHRESSFRASLTSRRSQGGPTAQS